MNDKLNELKELRAAAYKYASDTVGAPDSAFSEAHYNAFNAYIDAHSNAND